jgi:CDP-glycerol glycerophosphotransferase (TagB/SpsB family)
MMKFLAYLICYCIYPFSFLVPRSKKKWAFGSFRGAFNDNAKYLFIHVTEQMPDIDCAWLSVNRTTVRTIKEKGLKAYHVLSPAGIWFALRAKCWFFNAYSSDIMFCLSGGAKLVNLWHGLPLKRIEFDIESGILADRFVKKTLKERYFHPEVFKRPDYVVSSTELFSEVFARSFRIPLERCLNLGLARNEILTWPEEKRRAFIDRYEPTETLDLIGQMGNFDRVYVYMPTWRDSQNDFVTAGFDFKAMEEVLSENNALLLIKPHANTFIDPVILNGLAHIKLLPSTLDIYPVLPYTDVLITDYSSVMYDYILMEKKDVILYLFDKEEYVNERPFIWSFEDMTYGHRAGSFETLLELVGNAGLCPDEAKKAVLVKKCWGENSLDTCERISSFFKQS